jgi:hypothetical protein
MNARGATQLDGFLSVADDFLFDQPQGSSGGTVGGPSFQFSSAGDTATHSGHALIDEQGGGNFGALHVDVHDSSGDRAARICHGDIGRG